MPRNRLQILACFALVGLALLIAYRATEPAGDGPTPTPSELRSLEAHNNESMDVALARLSDDERRLRKLLKPDDWQAHLRVVQARLLYLRIRRLKETGGETGEVEPDPELRRLISLLRRYARTEQERSLTEQAAKGKG